MAPRRPLPAKWERKSWSFCLKEPNVVELLIQRANSCGAFDLKSKGSLEAHFELFWALVAKWLPDGLWRLILSCSGLWWPSGSQMVSGGSF